MNTIYQKILFFLFLFFLISFQNDSFSVMIDDQFGSSLGNWKGQENQGNLSIKNAKMNIHLYGGGDGYMGQGNSYYVSLKDNVFLVDHILEFNIEEINRTPNTKVLSTSFIFQIESFDTLLQIYFWAYYWYSNYGYFKCTEDRNCRHVLYIKESINGSKTILKEINLGLNNNYNYQFQIINNKGSIRIGYKEKNVYGSYTFVNANFNGYMDCKIQFGATSGGESRKNGSGSFSVDYFKCYQDPNSLKDSDRDGVVDPLDRCPDTDAGQYINRYGCPINGLFTQNQLNQAVLDATSINKAEINNLNDIITNIQLQNQEQSLTITKLTNENDKQKKHMQEKERQLNVYKSFSQPNNYTSSELILNNDNHHYYMKLDKAMTWHQAKKICKNFGGYLATINSESEKLFLLENYLTDIEITDQYYWLGGFQTEQFTWKWITNEPWSYSSWNLTNESNNYTNDNNYIYLNQYSDNSIQFNEYHQALPLCEWDTNMIDKALNLTLNSNALQVSINVLEDTIQYNRQEMFNANNRISQLQSSCSAFELSKTQLSNIILDKNVKISEISTALLQENENNSSLQKTISTLNDLLEQKESSITELKKEKTEYINNAEFLNSELDRYKKLFQDYSKYSITLNPGWHLISSLNKSATPKTIPSDCIEEMYTFVEGAYIPVTTFKPNKGYWVNVLKECIFILEP